MSDSNDVERAAGYDPREAPTLYEWLMRIRGMTHGVALDLDSRIPDSADMPTPQSLWTAAGVNRERRGRRDIDVLPSLMDFFDQVRTMIAENDDADSKYAEIYRHNLGHAKERMKAAGKFRNDPATFGHVAHSRARRETIKVLLSHIWTTCWWLDRGYGPPISFEKPIPPEVPYPGTPEWEALVATCQNRPEKATAGPTAGAGG